jgi:hypothetical protein
VIDGDVEVHFVAGGAELGGLRADERFEESAAVGLGVDLDQKVVEEAGGGVVARHPLVQRRNLERVVTLAHGALDGDDGMAADAADAGLGFGAVEVFFDGRIHHAAEEHGGVVAAAAPLGGLGADHVLHVLNALAVPLVVEGGEAVGRTLPLLVDVGVAALAGFRLHEVLGFDEAAVGGLGRAGEEGAVGAVAFFVHGGGGQGRILDR